jgi:predicted TIM-barrel fold metal-dependent hydrolase
VANQDVLISSDSHIMESLDLWVERLPAAFKDRAPRYDHLRQKNETAAHPGGNDPRARIKEMAVDGVSGEILYPTIQMDQFGMTDVALQEACFRAYNDWLIEYCSVSPERLYGIAAISVYNIDNAIKEMERCKKAGMRGVMIWQIPPAELSFATDHYDRFWAAAQEMGMPVSLHILTGAPFPPGELIRSSRTATALEGIHRAVNTKLLYVSDSLLDLVGSGTFDRFPNLKVVLVENEVSWMPFVVSQWDKYAARGGNFQLKAKMLPGEYVKRNVFATFFNDPPINWVLGNGWGTDNLMWSNDFPHPNSTWPKSREVIARDLGHLSAETRYKLVNGTVSKLYGLPKIGLLAS